MMEQLGAGSVRAAVHSLLSAQAGMPAQKQLRNLARDSSTHVSLHRHGSSNLCTSALSSA